MGYIQITHFMVRDSSICRFWCPLVGGDILQTIPHEYRGMTVLAISIKTVMSAAELSVGLGEVQLVGGVGQRTDTFEEICFTTW